VNGIFIPAGILQAPFYSPTQAVARNYGSVGCICGHEMTHGFDDIGREYDTNGMCVAVCCSVLQCVAVMLGFDIIGRDYDANGICVAVGCSVLQCGAGCYSDAWLR